MRQNMAATICVLIGPARSGKSFHLVGQYRQSLRRSAPAARSRVLWLAPTVRGAMQTRQAMLAGGLDACLQPGVTTFDRLADRVLATSNETLQLLTPCQQRALLHRVVRAAREDKQLDFLADVANRTGLIDLLVEHIRELKRRGVSPETFSKTILPGGNADQQAELAHLYARYEQLLASHGWCDAEGRQWAARDLLASDRCPWPESLELVVADGFTDFTPAQHDMLRSLAERSQRLLISLPGDGTDAKDSGTAPTGRDDLFAKPRATLAALRRHHVRLEVRLFSPRPSDWPALDHLSEHMFRNPRHMPPLPATARPSLDRLAIVAASGAQDEIVQLAREIKRRLVNGEAVPGDVVVVFRSLHDVAPRVREVFAQFGIPHFVETAVPLLASGAARTLLSLLRLEAEDWPFRRVVSVVTNNTLAKLAGPSRAATDWLVRDLQVARGSRALLERVEQLAADAESTPADHPAKRRHTSAVAALPLLRTLEETLHELPQRASAADWCVALERLGGQLGIAPLADSPDRAAGPQDVPSAPAPGMLDDHVAWQCVVDHLLSLDRLAARQNGSAPTPLSRKELLAALVDVATHESLPQPYDEVGRVRVLSAATARTIAAKHVFLAGMSELAFPAPERTGRLHSDDDYRFYQNAADQDRAASAPDPAPRSHEEMLLFYEVVTRASERLTLSFPAWDEKAQALPPSPYVGEVQRTLGPDDITRRAEPAPSPVPAGLTPLCPADWRLQAVGEALEGKGGLLAGLFQHTDSSRVAESLAAALRIIHARGHGPSFGPYEGLLVSPAVQERLAQRFGPQHLWSPSQFEEYAACPYRFLLNDVLALEPLGDLMLETDFARRGTLFHNVLAEFHRAQQQKLGPGRTPSAADKVSFLTEFQAALETVRPSLPRSGIDAALVEIDRRQIERWADRYYDDLLEYDRHWSEVATSLAPALFEIRFGPSRPGQEDSDDPQSVDRPFELNIGGESIQLTGRIDRIDVGRAGDRLLFNVIDYKSGKRPPLTAAKVESGERLQLPLYVMAAQAVIFAGEPATPMWAGYWSMKDGVTTQPRSSLLCSVDGQTAAENWESLQAAIAEPIGRFVAGMRHGDFPVASLDDQCTSHCQFNTVCRIAQVRSLAKTWPPDL